ncbi:MAG: alpha/beta fold hydrolase [Tidjanibacter sp.]|nr:alpha/beta fold hydrolase [Tidjanibacter sp.]
MKRLLTITIATLLSAATLSAQEVVGKMPRGWEPQTSYPMAWSGEGDFEEWRTEARAKVVELMGLAPAPPNSTDYQVVASEQREGYTAHKIEFEISANNPVRAYLLVPDGEGPFPALVALHDHGAKFSIGKEKMIRPIAESPEVVAEAEEWLTKCYDGVWTGDWFASQGYVVLAIDALMWGNRGEGTDGRETRYDTQQAVASNCLKLGTSLVGIITWDDLRSIDFLAAQEFVAADRIGLYGHSMGGHRAWMAAALSDKVRAVASVCWMATSDTLLAAGNNELKGGSAFAMQIPMVSRWLDNPDIASLACPRAALFISGTEDKLFPAGVEEAYEKMARVWRSQGAEGMFHYSLYPSPHYFDKTMQQEVADFFARNLLR